MTVLLQPTQHWACPNCKLRQITHEAQPHTRFHACVGLNGLTAPMVPAGSRVQVRAVEWQDYVGSEKVQTDASGRPFSAVITERGDGSNDVAVLAPAATASIRS